MPIEELLKDGENYKDFPQIPLEQIRLLWHNNFHDGPLSGICQVNGEMYWFNCCSEMIYTEKEIWNEDNTENEEDVIFPWYRRYLVHRMTPTQVKQHMESHSAFQNYVGTHTNYDENNKRLDGELKPMSEWTKFYDNPPSITVPNDPIGWFER